MIKRVLYFGNQCSLRKRDMQVLVEYPDKEAKDSITVPIEDVGIVVLDSQQIMVSNALLMALNENNSAVISCDTSHLPYGLMLPMFSHHAFTEKFYFQLEASVPLKKKLWQQTVVAKIENQSALLKKINMPADKMDFLIRQVNSGDTQNVEGRAAAYYWDNLFGEESFIRHRFGEPPNNLLNYGYAILRAIVARSLVGSGLFPTLGIHHHNKYNPYCLADDIMEPFRPYVDELILKIVNETPDFEELTPQLKRRLLEIPVIDIEIDGKNSPLMVGVQRTTASLVSCFEGESRKILYPSLN